VGSYRATNSSSMPQGGKGTSVAQQAGGGSPPPPMMSGGQGAPYGPSSQGGKGTSLAQQAAGGLPAPWMSALQNLLRPQPPRFKRGGRVRKKVNSVERALAVTRRK